MCHIVHGDNSLEPMTLSLSLSQDDLDEARCPLTLLANKGELSRAQVKQAMQKGALWFQPANKENGGLDNKKITRPRKSKVQRLRRLTRTFHVGDTFFLYYNAKILEEQPLEAILLHDEGDYSVWYKPYGMYAQGSKWGDHCTINRWAESHLLPQRPAFIVHRLDRATTGLILLAHNKKSAAALSLMFEHHHLSKIYHAIVHGKFIHDEQRLTIHSDIDNRNACSHVSLLQYNSDNTQSLLLVEIDTGRKHQIRRHLSEYGFPVVGDRLYGKELVKAESKNLQLSACILSFVCPITKQKKHFELPDNLKLLF